MNTNDDDIRQIVFLVCSELRPIFDQQIDLIARLMATIERHELEILHQRESPPPATLKRPSKRTARAQERAEQP